MSSNKTIILITGANNGIGLEVASQLLQASANNHVILTSRSLAKGEAALAELQGKFPSAPGSAEVIELDVTQPEVVERAAKQVEAAHGRLDVLVNNAGIAFFPPGTPVPKMFRETYETNVIGVQTTSDAFSPLLKKSTSTPRLLNVSSGVGSITQRLDPADPTFNMPGGAHYRASKAALNMVTACLNFELAPHGIKLFSIDPGFTVSDLSPNNRAEKGARPTADAATFIVRIVNGEEDAKAGGFLTEMEGKGGLLPW
ncbi:hypothetical protein OC846_006083 [Tilletia horrida]|uniref:NAD(P)-binding protein n=1 Tax=Tilletia horrida TaxID=155126 RepID=A0AAN6GPC0_9BASI|nr:hypothetical protein OC846_006083 [Tilletia horrida]KAK0564600.1 hypothetical protein OC861_004190 [Tilletia horrida]